ncbi:MAG: hypothetical protein KBE09_04825, partial [Candidatus Pacebacteria bacterium]|nr:hypothetical protein [Candidatus Paceibacterota bacterium]
MASAENNGCDGFMKWGRLEEAALCVAGHRDSSVGISCGKMPAMYALSGLVGALTSFVTSTVFAVSETAHEVVGDAVPAATAIAEHAPEASHSGIHVALAAERLGTFMGIPITNTLITAWVVMAVLITLAWLVRR